MSTECNRALMEAEKKLAYYKDMYHMRTEAYINLEKQYRQLEHNYDLARLDKLSEDVLRVRMVEMLLRQ